MSTALGAAPIIVQTSKGGDRLVPKEQLARDADASIRIEINDAVTFQTIEGFGASFTESSAWNLATLPIAKRDEVLDRLFNPETGLGFSLARTHINSSDYSLRHYSYVRDHDLELKSFSIEEDKQGFSGVENAQVKGIKLDDPSFDLLPMILAAQRVPGAEFSIIASPWSPPSWMKDGEHKEMTGGYLKKDTDDKGRKIYWDAWARYLVKYVIAYSEAGVATWGLTPQNEPGHADNASWDTCKWTADEQREFIADYLGPELVKAGLIDTSNLEHGLKLFIFDHNKFDLIEFATTVLDDPAAAQYVYGTAFHWYAINYTGKADYRGDAIAALASRYPKKKLLHTESSIDIHPHAPIGQYWDPTNRDWTGGRFTPFSQYATDIITDLNNGAIGYIDWCVVLSTTGGPNPYNNFNSASVLVDPYQKTVIYTPIYYLLGHFSKYVRPGALRIGLAADLPADVHATAFRNTDGSIVAVVFNDTEAPVVIKLEMNDESVLSQLDGDAVQTIVIPQSMGSDIEKQLPVLPPKPPPPIKEPD